MTQNPRDAVQFTRESADRIAGVVRTIELTPTPGRPLTFESVMQSSPAGKPFRVATFTAAWDIGTEQVLTFANQTATPNTVVAVNQLYDVAPLSSTQPQVCAIAREGTAWQFVNMLDSSGAARKATFSGEWGKGTSKTVQFAGGDTASATNSLYKVPSGASQKTCIVAKEGNTWHFVNESHACPTGKDKDSLTTEEQTLSDQTSNLKALISSGDGQCMKWVELKTITVITDVRFEDNGAGPILKTKICKVWVPAFGLPGSYFFQSHGSGFVDVSIPVAGCAVQ